MPRNPLRFLYQTVMHNLDELKFHNDKTRKNV